MLIIKFVLIFTAALVNGCFAMLYFKTVSKAQHPAARDMRCY